MSPHFSTLFTLALAATSAFAKHPNPTRVKRDGAVALNPEAAVVSIPGVLDIVSGLVSGTVAGVVSTVDSLTNAKRFALGLSPKSPRRLHSGRAHAARAQPSGTPSSSTGYVLVKDASTGTEYGYIRPATNVFGEFGYFTSDPSSALKVTIPSGATTGFDLSIENAPFAQFPYFGGVEGFSSDSPNINVGSPNYVVIAGTSQTPSNSPPVDAENSFSTATNIPKTIASSIWNLDSTTNELSPQWINVDSSLPSTSIVYVESEPLFALIGDYGSFIATYGTAVQVTFTFIPA